VALKVLPFAAALDSRQLQRFKNEAQAAAQLHHTNIVPVFGVGCERGVHYYAMQFIDGQTVAALIAQLRQQNAPAPTSVKPSKPVGEPTVAYTPTYVTSAAPSTVQAAAVSTQHSVRSAAYFRTVARLGVQAAEALDHAHQLGVVHRDVKPANLLVDERGTLWVTDFGLAHVQSQAGLTMSGDLVGTLRYMSPEQALAQRVVIDHRTDVYSLGATFYELLTLQPAFGGTDRQELLRQIAFEEPKPPRRLNRAIPAELEVITLKALEKNPAERYATARELADDLERFLRDEPIRARRPTLLQRARKWSRRHRPVVWSAAVVLLLVLVLGGGSWLWWAQRRAALEGEVKAAVAESLRLQEEDRWPEALSAARRAEALLAGGAVDAELQRRVRERRADLEMVARLEEIRLLQAGEKDERYDPARHNRAYADAFREYGIDMATLDPLEAADRIRKKDVRAQLAAALDEWAMLRRYIWKKDDTTWKDLLTTARAGDPDAWRNRLRDALEHRDAQALKELAASEQTAGLPPSTLVLMGGALRANGGREQAVTLLRQAQRRHPGDFWINFELAYCLHLQDSKPSQLQEAIRFYTAALALRPQRARAHNNLGSLLRAMGRLDEAIAEFREDLRLQKDLEDLADTHYNLGNVLSDKGQLEEAIAEYCQAIRLKKDDAAAHNNLGNALRDKGQLDEAIAEWREAIRLNKDSPEAHNNLGNALRDKGQLDEAIAEYREAIRLEKGYHGPHYNLGAALGAKGQLEEAIAEYRQAIRLKMDYPEAHDNLGVALHHKGQLDEAIAEHRAALRLKPDYPGAHNNLGNALRDKGQLDEAIAEYREAIRLRPDDEGAHSNLGGALKDKGQLDEAIAEHREAIRLKPDFAAAHNNLGDDLVSMGALDEAIASCQRAIRLQPDIAEFYLTLGDALLKKGEFNEALAARRRGHELGSKRPYWPHPSRQWVQECQRLVDLEPTLEAVLRGDKRPADAAERTAYAKVCLLKGWSAAGASLYQEAFAAKSELAADLKAEHRFNAACSAALAGCGRGKDTNTLDESKRASWRHQALDWLRADLTQWAKRLDDSSPQARSTVAKTLAHWQADPDLGGVRGETALAKLPEAEREGWRKLWADVADTLARAQGKTVPSEKSPKKP
jgi:tetratricopeptide (TPR) repeat protein